MRVGQGKKHEWFWLGDGVIDTASTPSLSDPSTEHEREPGHTPTADRCTAPGRRTRGYFCFTRRKLIFAHLY